MFKISIWKKEQTRFCSSKGTCKCFQIDVKCQALEGLKFFESGCAKLGGGILCNHV